MSNRVSYVTEDNDGLATWIMYGRPQVGDQIHRDYGPGGTWQVTVVQHRGDREFRCICVPVQLGDTR